MIQKKDLGLGLALCVLVLLNGCGKKESSTLPAPSTVASNPSPAPTQEPREDSDSKQLEADEPSPEMDRESAGPDRATNEPDGATNEPDTSTNDPGRATNERMPVNVSEDDFAFLTTPFKFPEDIGLIDPSLEMRSDENGVEFRMDETFEKVYVVYRKRMTGDFRFEIDLDDTFSDSDDQTPVASTLRTDTQTSDPGQSRFRTRRNRAELEVGFLVPEKRVAMANHRHYSSGKELEDGPLLVVQREEGKISNEFRGNRTKIHLDSRYAKSSGYLVFGLTPNRKLRIRNINVTGESDRLGFETRQFDATALQPSLSDWTTSVSGPNAKIEDIALTVDDQSLLFRSATRGQAFMTLGKRLEGDFSFGGTIVPENSESIHYRGALPIFIGMSRDGGRPLASCFVYSKAPGAPINFHVYRYGATTVATVNGKSEVWKDTDGPVLIHLRSDKQDFPVRLKALQLFAQNANDVKVESPPVIGADGWQVDTTYPGWHPDMSDRMEVTSEGQTVDVKVDSRGLQIPFFRLLPDKEDFEVTWRVHFPPANMVPAGKEKIRGVRLRVCRQESQTPHASVTLGPPLSNQETEYFVTVRRQNGKVTLAAGGTIREESFDGALRAELYHDSGALYSIKEYAEGGVSDRDLLAETKRGSRDPTFVEYAMPGKITRIRTAGEGRFLLLQSAEQQMLYVFDLEEKKIVKTFAAPRGSVVAGGRSDIVIVDPATQQISRYAINGWAKRKLATLDRDWTTVDIAMGDASDGPILLTRKRSESSTNADDPAGLDDKLDVQFLDLRRLEPLRVKLSQRLNLEPKWLHLLRAASDGRVFTCSPRESCVLELKGRICEVTKSPNQEFLYPLSDRNVLCSERGVLDSELKLLRQAPNPNTPSQCFPLANSPFYVVVTRQPGTRNSSSSNGLIQLRHPDRELPVATSRKSEIRHSTMWAAQPRERMAAYAPQPHPDERVHYHAPTKSLVLLPDSNDRITVEEIDPLRSLQESGDEYFLVLSTPKPQIMAGEMYRYAIEVASAKRIDQFELTRGPKGMTINDDGLIEWQVPGAAETRSELVVVRVTDESGKAIFHSFDVMVDNAGNSFEVMSADEIAEADRRREQEQAANLPAPGETVTLPGHASRVAVGAAGRLLVFHFEKQRKLGFVDLKQRKLVAMVDIPDQALFACGAEKMVIVQPQKQIIQRLDYRTLKPELSLTYDLPSVGAVAMGSASDGPILLTSTASVDYSKNSFVILDLENLRPIDLTIVGDQSHQPRELSASHTLRVAANGRTFLWSQRSKAILLSLTGSQGRWSTVNDSGHQVTPMADGERFISQSGVFRSDQPFADGAEKNTPRLQAIPAQTGDLYLRMAFQKQSDKTKQVLHELFLHAVGTDQALLRLNPVSFAKEDATSTAYRDRISVEQRVTLVPALNQLAVIPYGNDRVVISDLDLWQRLKESETDYLFVASTPPTSVFAGQKMLYRIATVSKQGGVSYQLASGPDGMTIDENGAVEWTPRTPTDPPAVSIVKISDASGDSIYHSFAVQVRSRSSSSGLDVASSENPDSTGEADTTDLRTWSDKSGRFKMEARFVRREGGEIFLRRENGSEVKISLSQLSDDDQSYVTELGR